jgi:hypothetical protein
MTELNTIKLRRAASAIYLACEREVADDISCMLLWAANRIDALEAIVSAAEDTDKRHDR